MIRLLLRDDDTLKEWTIAELWKPEDVRNISYNTLLSRYNLFSEELLGDAMAGNDTNRGQSSGDTREAQGTGP